MMQKKQSREKKNHIIKLFWLFMTASFLGAVVEILFCYLTTGHFMSRSSLVIGQFSLVWGLGVVLFTLSLYWMKNKADRYIFLAGTLLGGIFEYICSVVTEVLFGSVFWDYSGFRLNIGGRINLIYCLGWGIIAVLWVRTVYPVISGWVDRIIHKAGRTVTLALAIFMLGNMMLSTMALERYTHRQSGRIEEETEMDLVLDACFPDSLMERRYPSLKIRQQDGSLIYPGKPADATLKSVAGGAGESVLSNVSGKSLIKLMEKKK